MHVVPAATSPPSRRSAPERCGAPTTTIDVVALRHRLQRSRRRGVSDDERPRRDAERASSASARRRSCLSTAVGPLRRYRGARCGHRDQHSRRSARRRRCPDAQRKRKGVAAALAAVDAATMRSRRSCVAPLGAGDGAPSSDAVARRDEHGARGVADDPLRGAAERQASHGAPAARAEHEQVEPLAGEDELARWASRPPPSRRRPRPGSRSRRSASSSRAASTGRR